MKEAVIQSTDEYNSENLPHLLATYYNLLFPYKLFYKWLSYGNVIDDYFSRREFSFTLEGDIYIRYLSFQDADDFHKVIVNRNPIKIDIGAVFNVPPKDSKKNDMIPFKALERELIFDIDLTDYDEIRNCCDGANICKKCWIFMIIAVKILERSLKNDFGFKHLLFVYSGRRGIHCWVNDRRARELTFEARSAIVEYLTLVSGGDYKSKKTSFYFKQNLHPSVLSALQIIDEYFPRLISEQGWLDDQQKFDQIIELCSQTSLKAELKKLYDPKLKPVDLWRKIEAKCAQSSTYFAEEIKIQYSYPRLDINVSKGVNHLLKAPFSVHPKTGRVSVPIDINRIDSFDPFKVPIISQICAQLDSNRDDSKAEAYERTALHSSVARFNKFINSLIEDNKLLRNKQSDETLEF